MLTMNKTCLSYWYPKIKDLVPTPETRVLVLEEDLMLLAYGEEAVREKLALIPELRKAKKWIHTMAVSIGYPVFLRTGLYSGKHSWGKTCYLRGGRDPEPTEDEKLEITKHVSHLIDESAMADLIGLSVNVWVVRRLLRTEPAFYAFHGRMPITREFRFFVFNGLVIHKQPYWPPESILQPSKPNWMDRLEAISVLGADDPILTTLTERVGAKLDGCWSVDWLWAEGKWWLTDMAEGEKSFRWDPDGEPE